jgi:hypothetical protein
MVTSSMTPLRFRGSLCAVCVLSSIVWSARADPPSAASLFDEGVGKFKRAEYEAAADAFLRADEASPNEQALLNAIAAGRRGHAHLLVARAAQRAIDRKDTSADLARLAREALTEAAAQLARVELSCAAVAPAAKEAPSCALTIDSVKTASGVHYLLPGTHRFIGEAAGGRDEQPLTCNAGATYTVVLRPAAPVAEKTAPVVTATATAAPTAKTGWPPAVVYAGAGVTAVLAGVAIWSGADALAAKDALPAIPRRAQNEDVLGRAHRTDALIACAALAGAFTLVAGVWLVSWERPNGKKTAVGVKPSSSGVEAVIRGRF